MRKYVVAESHAITPGLEYDSREVLAADPIAAVLACCPGLLGQRLLQRPFGRAPDCWWVSGDSCGCLVLLR